jgi:hypothetical protein
MIHTNFDENINNNYIVHGKINILMTTRKIYFVICENKEIKMVDWHFVYSISTSNHKHLINCL